MEEEIKEISGRLSNLISYILFNSCNLRQDEIKNILKKRIKSINSCAYDVMMIILISESEDFEIPDFE